MYIQIASDNSSFATTRNASLTLTTFIAIVDGGAQQYQRVQQHSEPSHVIVDRHFVGRTRRIYTTIERSDKILFIRTSVRQKRKHTCRAETRFAPSFLPSIPTPPHLKGRGWLHLRIYLEINSSFDLDQGPACQYRARLQVEPCVSV